MPLCVRGYVADPLRLRRSGILDTNGTSSGPTRIPGRIGLQTVDIADYLDEADVARV